MREVFLDILPTKDGVGKNIGRKVFDWDKSVGYSVDFIYDDIKGEIKIIDYEKIGQHLKVRYQDKDFKIKTNNLQRGSIGGLLNKFSKHFKAEIGQVFKDNKRDLIIIEREYRNKELKPDSKGRIYKKNEKWYKYKCNQCGWKEGWIEEGSLVSQVCGCSCCYGRTAVLGINTIWDTDRWMVDVGISEEDAKKYTSGSHQYINVKCPNCGREKEMQIDSIRRRKSICCICSDGISYPEKFMAETLNQLNINYICQLSKKDFDWCDKYKYDFYLPDYNMIIETHGEQHYKDCKWTKVKDVVRNDTYKKQLAEKNILKCKYTVVDCRYSELDWIKKNILKSRLKDMFDLSNINWLLCQEFALSNLVKEVCDYWNEKKEHEKTKDLARIYKISDVTVRKYLNSGSKLGWCDYNGVEEMKKSGRVIGKMSCKKVGVFKGNTYLNTFNSCTELSEKSKEIFGVTLNIGNISQVCTGKRKSHKGFIFKYIDESQQIAS